jgi:copper resistance protein D
VTGNILLLSVLLSAISDCAFALAIGMMLAGYYWLDGPEMILADRAFSAATARKWLTGLGIAMVATQLMRPWFLAASMSGGSRFAGNLALIPTVLSLTHQGMLWKVDMIAMLTFLAVTAWILRPRNRTTYFAAMLCLCIIAFVKAASGHAGDDGDFTGVEMLQWLHILATAAWGGGVIASGLIVLPALLCTTDNAMLQQYLRRLSKVATYAVIAIAITGIYNGDRELGAPIASLPNSTWGKILIVKVIVVVFALSLGAMNRFVCLNKGASEEAVTRSHRLLWIEAVAILVVLGLSGWLGNLDPGMRMKL